MPCQMVGGSSGVFHELVVGSHASGKSTGSRLLSKMKACSSARELSVAIASYSSAEPVGKKTPANEATSEYLLISWLNPPAVEAPWFAGERTASTRNVGGSANATATAVAVAARTIASTFHFSSKST